MSLPGKKIVVGITGGIAAYKMPDLIRRLVKEGAEVTAVLTKNGARFVGTAALSTVTGRGVITDLFPDPSSAAPGHVALADWADCLLVAPATADIIGKFARGIADDFLSTFYLSARCPVVIAPAMNDVMYAHPAVQQNLRTLGERGALLVEPAEGELACGKKGKGRLADPESLLFAVRRALTPQDMKGLRVLVTAGGTEEAVDPVRVITNRSSGKMGQAVAINAAERGADVTLLHGRMDAAAPAYLAAVPAASSARMLEEAASRFKKADVLVMAAAVADFSPLKPSDRKIKKERGAPVLALKPAPDILARLSAAKGKRKIIGFALESENLVESAREKMKKKKCDLMIANPPATLGSDLVSFSVIEKNGRVHPFDQRPKQEAARLINDFIVRL